MLTSANFPLFFRNCFDSVKSSSECLCFGFFIISYMFPYIIYSCSTYINCSALASCLFFNWTDFTVANGLNKKKMVHSLKVVSEKKLLGYLFGICQHNCTYIWSLIVETQKPRTVIIKLEFCSLSEMVHQYPSINNLFQHQ